MQCAHATACPHPTRSSPMRTTSRTVPLTTTKRLQCSRVHVTARAKNATPQHEPCANAETNARYVRNAWCPRASHPRPRPEPSHVWRPAHGPDAAREMPTTVLSVLRRDFRQTVDGNKFATQTTLDTRACREWFNAAPIDRRKPHAPIFNVGARLRKPVLRNLRRSLGLLPRAAVHGQH